MKNLKHISLQNLTESLKDLQLQEGYIHIPDFKITPDITEPYRANYYCIGLVQEGDLILQSNFVTHSIKGPAIIFAEPSSIKSWKIPIRPYKAESILISDIFLQERLIEHNIISIFSDMTTHGTFVSDLPEEDFDQIKLLFNLINEFTPPENVFQKGIISGIVYTMINIVGNLYLKKNYMTKIPSGLNLRFKRAVVNNSFKERDIKFYADLLNIHPKYLSQAIRSETGYTAGKWIQIQVILEAKILLQKSDITIGKIAELLNFPDQSTFGKYFKKYSNMSPSKYREYIKKIM